jgi:hypothetical protein
MRDEQYTLTDAIKAFGIVLGTVALFLTLVWMI